MSRRAVFLNVHHLRRQARSNPPSTEAAHRPLLGDVPQDHRFLHWRERVVSVYEEVRERRSRDQRLLVRNFLIATNACTSVFLMVAMMQLGWRDSVEWQNNDATRIIKIVLSCSTAVLLLQILDLYRAKVLSKAQEIKTVRKPWTKRKPFDMLRFNSTWIVVWKNSSLRWKFWLEVVICCFHPFPGTNEDLTKAFGMAMFLRAYVLLSLARDFNPIYTHRALIQKIPGISRARMVDFSTWMVVKMFFREYPIPFILTGMTFLLGFTSYGMYIYEREAEERFTYAISIYVSVSSMLIGWPDDVYTHYDPTTWGAKFFAFVAAISGLFFFALLIDYVHTRMHPAHIDSLIVDWITRLRLEDKEKEEAARLIQLVWRAYRRRKYKEELSFEASSDRSLAQIPRRVQAAPGRKTYQVLFLKQCKKIRRVRKEIAEIVERTSQHSSAGGAPSTMTSAGGHGQSDRVIHPDSGAGTGSLADAPGAEEEFGPGGGGGLPARQQLNVAAVVKRSQKRLMFKIANLLEEHRQELMRDLGQVCEEQGENSESDTTEVSLFPLPSSNAQPPRRLVIND